MHLLNKTSLAVALALASTQTLAAGFQLNSQSATGIGRAFSGEAAIGDNASVLSRNPAAMALFDEKALSIGLTYAQTDVEVKDLAYQQAPTTGFGSIDDAADNKLIPNLYYIQPYNNNFSFGFAAFSNFGTGTDTSSFLTDNPGATLPVDLLGNTEVTTINFNGSLSWRVNKHFSVGAGIDAVYGEGLLTRQGKTAFSDSSTLVDVDADGWGFGGIVGALIEFNKDNRIGISYRESPDIKVKGVLNTLTPNQEKTALLPVVSDELEVPLPDIWQIGGFHQLTDQFAIHYTAQYTSWGDFEKITLQGNKIGTTQVPDSALKVYKWEDSWLYSIGGTYSVNQDWTLRAGYLFDDGVVGELSSISIPDSDRDWYTAGIGFNLDKNSTIDFGLAYVKGENTEVIENSAILGGVNIIAHTNASATYYSVQYSYNF
ncbi:aromatic hydrocarbon degradation protein [Parashewanella spongiae]|uniref:Aromatic hydrocarbon degradation protein n=1 Tax=Parashewanella spongiae TaxID=342950 RepID=A0A3A6UBX4_9GAMM|nr:outer membrane protein transport protein [Parashewanella spongiae]MCL1077001.1 outer membrane protein transport protein [Parashewanella spongiae]RJY19106.1 aromatic hydrocarbon degradation protein [Parashewanella spongiae]